MILLLVASTHLLSSAEAQILSGSVTFTTGGPPNYTDNWPSAGGAFSAFGPNSNGADSYEIASANYGSTPDNLPPNVTFAWMYSMDSQMTCYPIASYMAYGYSDAGTEDGGVTVISVASGCTTINQITDASSYALSSGALQVLPGDFLILKNVTAGFSGYYGVVQLTSGCVQSDGTAVATFNWWLLTDGSADFSIAPAPEPSTAALLLLTAGAAAGWLRRRPKSE